MNTNSLCTFLETAPADVTPQNGAQELNKAAIAALAPCDIRKMTREDLQRVIRAAGIPLLPSDILDRIRYYDRETLERLAYLARQSCRHEANWPSLLAR